MVNTVIAHAEIPVIDIERSKMFFKKLFDWDFKNFGKGYELCTASKSTSIGLRKTDKIISGDTTIFHILVDDIDEKLDKAKTLGGKIFREKTVIPILGWYALINDPDGNIIGLYQTH